MNIFRNLDKLPKFKKAVVTIGTFDGVHLGHQKIIRQLQELAGEIQGESLLITFHPHPRMVINPEDDTKLLSTLDEKTILLRQYGLDNLVVVPFSREFSRIEASSYIKDFLIRNFNPAVLVIGYDHRFGKNREGNIAMLREICDPLAIRVIEISKQTIEDIGISSTRIRKALLAGEVQKAAALLGHPYALSGIVVKGEQIGRQLGYPTANIHVEDASKLVPADGIYAVRVNNGGTRSGGMLSIGFRPTFQGMHRTIEVNIFDFNKDIYGEQIRIEFVKHLRSEEKFNSREELVKAMDQDKINSLKALNA